MDADFTAVPTAEEVVVLDKVSESGASSKSFSRAARRAVCRIAGKLWDGWTHSQS